MLNIVIYDTSGTMKRVTKRCNLLAALMQNQLKVESISTFY